jgi:hypothetical protein
LLSFTWQIIFWQITIKEKGTAMLTPGKYDITIYQGATFDLPIQYRDSNNAPVNMSGYTISGTIWNRIGTQKITDFAIPWVSQASGMFKLRLEASGTARIAEQGQYDVRITQPNGDIYYLLEGNAFLNLGLI